MAQVPQQRPTEKKLRHRLVLWRLAQVLLAIVVVSLTAQALAISLEVEVERSNKERSNNEETSKKKPDSTEESIPETHPTGPLDTDFPTTFNPPRLGDSTSSTPTYDATRSEPVRPGWKHRKLTMARAPKWSSRQLQAVSVKAKNKMQITPGEALVPLAFAVYTFLYAGTLMGWTYNPQARYKTLKFIEFYVLDIILDSITIGMWLSMVAITAVALSQRAKAASHVINIGDVVVDHVMPDSNLKALCAMCALLFVTTGLACHDSAAMKAQRAKQPPAPQDSEKNPEFPVSVELSSAN